MVMIMVVMMSMIVVIVVVCVGAEAAVGGEHEQAAHVGHGDGLRLAGEHRAVCTQKLDKVSAGTPTVTKASRSLLKGHKPAILWFTGLSGAGKSTIANLVERKLAAMGAHTYGLDGDNIRQGLNKDLGFTDEERIENIRRIGEVAKLFVDSGFIVTASFISPFSSSRRCPA